MRPDQAEKKVKFRECRMTHRGHQVNDFPEVNLDAAFLKVRMSVRVVNELR